MYAQKIVFSSGSVWWGDVPSEWMFEPSGIREVLVSTPNLSAMFQQAICIKLYIHDRSGILGCQYIPDSTNRLCIQVHILDETDESKIVNAGIPSQLADSIIRGAMAVASEPGRFGGGILKFHCGAWDRISSDSFIFELLARSAVRLIVICSVQPTPEQIRAVVKGESERIRNSARDSE